MNTDVGFRRVAALVPPTRPADVTGNVDAIIALARDAAEHGAAVGVFPELAVTAYTCADLFFQPALLDAAERGLATFLNATAQLDSLFVLGLPVRTEGRLFNAAAVTVRGRLLGLVPKSFLPNTREFYERRWFAPAALAREGTVRCADQTVPFGADLVFAAERDPALCVGVELCEDLWSPIPPSTDAALGGALLLCNLSASDELVGKAAYRKALVLQQSARCFAAYLYAGAGPGESTTDLVFGGHALIAENGRCLAEGPRFGFQPRCLTADVDLDWLRAERMQSPSFAETAATRRPPRRVPFDTRMAPVAVGGLRRPVERHPFVPADPARRDEHCAEVFAIQSTGLATRLKHAGFGHTVLGLSGGLDSTLALLVATEALQRLALPPEHLHVLTLPGPGTSAHTLQTVRALCEALHLPIETIDISDACRRHLADLGHDGQRADITFENAQARERTQILMNRANMLDALVIGTGDLSELALGWCTYNGDHMSMYGVNAGVPKTLVRHLIEWYAERRADAPLAAVLRAVAATPISPELLPPGPDGTIAQRTEDVLGPYELHDFYLYHFVRYGAPPEKLLRLAQTAFAGCYDDAFLREILERFLRRFFAQQFKRSCLPDGPKVGTLNLSPRGDWRMPSDASAAAWLDRCDDADAQTT